MTHTLTLELPDALYQQLQLRSQRTKRSLEEELLTAFAVDLPRLPADKTVASAAYDEVISFLSSGPSPLDILQFQLTDDAQHRVQELALKEQEQGLNPEEASELEFYVELGDFLGILRAKAQINLRNRP